MRYIKWMIRGHWTDSHAYLSGSGRTGCNKPVPAYGEKQDGVVTSERDVTCKTCKKFYQKSRKEAHPVG